MAYTPPSKRAGVGGGGFSSRAPKKNFYFLGLRFLAVFAAALKAAAVGAPLVPGLRIFSLDPAFMRRLLAAMLAYSPFFGISISSI